MNILIKNIILFIAALFMLSTIGLFGLFYTLIYSIINFTKSNFIKYWADLVYTINIGIDKIGNVLLGTFLNKYAVVELQYKFGHINDTISYALAKNIGHLSLLGKFIANILEYLDPGHLKKSIDKKI